MVTSIFLLQRWSKSNRAPGGENELMENSSMDYVRRRQESI